MQSDFSTEYKVLETRELFNNHFQKEMKWKLISVPLSNIGLNKFNNRFAPDEAMTEEEHENAIINEDVTAFENLQVSMANNPQFEQLIGYTNESSIHIHLIGGHRRYFAAKRNGEKDLLVWVTDKLTSEEIEHIRDWQEIHQTKVAHTPYAKNKAIYNDLKGRSEEEKEQRIEVWKQKGYKKNDVLKAERIHGRMESFCHEMGEKTQDRVSQVKAFETYDNICMTTLDELRNRGEFKKVNILDKISKAFLKHQIAHDDLKVTIDVVSELSLQDPVFVEIEDKPQVLSDEKYLRKLTANARSEKTSGSAVEGVKEFTARLYSKLIERSDLGEMEECLLELKDGILRIETALSTVKGA